MCLNFHIFARFETISTKIYNYNKLNTVKYARYAYSMGL